MTAHDVANNTTPETQIPPSQKSGRRKAILTVAGVLLLVAAVYEGYHWWTFGRFEISTDDAYVQADITTLAAKVSGYVASIAITENQFVQTGDVIARIDDGDYKLAVEAAQGRIASQEATISRIGEQIKVAEAAVTQAQSQITLADVNAERSAKEFDRQSKLASSNYASQAALDNARADKDRAAANVQGANAALVSAQANLGVMHAQQLEAQRNLAEYKTSLERAQRDLDFTIIRAPISGVVGNKALEVGKLVSVGQRLAVIVPLSDVYVEANFKETQLDSLRPGQPVSITIDSYSGKVFTGTVESIAPASGALFSLLPPENATGNFTKIVQRIPVRIALSEDALRAHVLRAGMSVEARVDTRAHENVAHRDRPDAPRTSTADEHRMNTN
ncbi:HlyD family secretion protein [Pseudochelatococcus sp. G4_1912]|uniref:HlyD family secretion protein n=1 Tax=Pseudochelatococcus sp. G4_1912 TaxID=3114288 RepID=UPI0039C5FA5D